MEEVTGISPDALVSLLSGRGGDCPHHLHHPSASTLVLDCRPFMSFNQGHVVDALNVHCPPILKRRSGGFVALENIVPCPVRREALRLGRYRSVVVYDQATSDLAAASADRDSNLYSVVKSLVQQVEVEHIYFLVGGYEAFSEECPLLCATQQFSPLSNARSADLPCHAPDDQPVEILPHLLLGNVQPSARRELLQRLGVTAIVNVSSSCPNHFLTDFRYLHIPVDDSATEDLASWFPVTNRFIDDVRSEGGRVLVHCYAGRSRSATVCLAYLMTSLDLSLDAAFEHVRARREVIDPNLNFMRQLQDYRQRLDSQRSTCGGPSPLSGPSTSWQSNSVSTPLQQAKVSDGPLTVCGSVHQPRPVLSPVEAQAAISLPACTSSSSSRPGSYLSPTYSAPPPSSPATATAADASQCFFSFGVSDLPFTAGDSLARTPEILLPS